MQHAPGNYALGAAYAMSDGAAVVLLNNTDVEQSAQRALAETLLETLRQAR